MASGNSVTGIGSASVGRWEGRKVDGRIYAKLFRRVFYGSMKGQRNVQHVWFCLLAHKSADGVVELPPDIVSRLTGIPEPEVLEAIQILESEDGISSSPEEGGRRIVRIEPGPPWCWIIVNAEKYEKIASITQMRDETRSRVARHRERNAANKQVSGGVTLNVTPKSRDPIRDRERDRDIKLPRSNGDLTATEAFDQIFWPKYPRKVAKARAKRAWNTLKLKDDDDETFSVIMAQLRNDIDTEWKDRTFDKIPHPATWINDRRWEDNQ